MINLYDIPTIVFSWWEIISAAMSPNSMPWKVRRSFLKYQAFTDSEDDCMKSIFHICVFVNIHLLTNCFEYPLKGKKKYKVVLFYFVFTHSTTLYSDSVNKLAINI